MQVLSKLQTMGLVLLLGFSISACAQTLPDFTELVDEVSPAVVNVEAVHTVNSDSRTRGAMQQQLPPQLEEFFERFFGDRMRPGVPRMPPARSGTGSGFIISEDGYILTNHHVVAGAEEVIVTLSDRREFQAEVVGTDQATDIALLNIDADNLPTVEIGNSRKLEAGEWVVAIGSPFGFEHSVTAGIISATGRPLPNQSYVPFIQTDVAINKGNSGGPLINMEGEVIGINSQIFSSTGGYMGVSFAIPIHVAMNVVGQLKGDGEVDRGWLGVQIQEVSPELAEVLGLEDVHGALISQVMSGSPAEEAGLKVRDVIVRFNNQRVVSFATLPPIVGLVEPGTTVPVTVVRDGERKTISVTIGELDGDGGQPDSEENVSGGGSLLGLVVEDVPEERLEEMEIDGGVVVSRVLTLDARRSGIRPGDVIVSVDNVPVENEEQFDELVEALEPGRPVALLVRRGEASLFIALTPEGNESEE